DATTRCDERGDIGRRDHGRVPTAPTPTSDVMTADEVAEFIGVDCKTVYYPTTAPRQALVFRRGALVCSTMQRHVDSDSRIAMRVRRASDGRWRYRHVVHKPDGTRNRINGSTPEYINAKVAAERGEMSSRRVNDVRSCAVSR